MKNMKRVISGIGFLAAAVFVIVGSMGYFGDIGVWTLIFSFALIMILVNGLFKLRWGMILFPLAFLAILYDEMLGIEQLTPWPVLGAALFGTIGLSILFGKGKCFVKPGNMHWGHKGGENTVSVEQSETDENFRIEVAFGTTVKYVKSQNLKRADVENSFGSVTVYFDEAQLNNGEARVRVENSFGKVSLYIPAGWNTMLDVEEAFGHVREKGRCAGQSDNTLYIKGETSFGDIEINYI